MLTSPISRVKYKEVINLSNQCLFSLNRSCVSGEARQDQPCAVHGVAGHHDAGPAAHAHHARQPAVRPHILQLTTATATKVNKRLIARGYAIPIFYQECRRLVKQELSLHLIA